MTSKDEALKEWLDVNVPELPASSKIPSPDRAVAREAWHAAVKHTLEHVAGDVNKVAFLVNRHWDDEQGSLLADYIMKLKP